MVNRKNIMLVGSSGVLADQIIRNLNTYFDITGMSRNPRPNDVHLQGHIPVNLTQIESTLISSAEAFGGSSKPFHGLILNSAMAYDDLVVNMKVGTLSDMVNVNLLSQMVITRDYITHCLRNGIRGRIVFVSSVASQTAYKGLAMYGATKAGMEAFIRGVAREYGGKDIRAISVGCGFMETAMTDAIDENTKDKIYNRTSLKQPTNPVDVAHFIGEYMQGRLNSMTGTTVMIDSGTL
jgi:3-oxoacyl-[acyl-carrier protein] reductase